MRIIAGRLKGRRLKPVKSNSVRSTADRVKESLFNILQSDCADADVLDLFCGAGTLGMEALSRGARYAAFVDRKRQSVVCTQENLETLGLEGESLVISAHALSALHTLGERGDRFSLIFADPPYGDGWPPKVLKAVGESNALADEGILVIEHHKKELPGDPPAGFSIWTERRFGDTMFTIWRWHRDSDDGADALPTDPGDES